VVFSLKTDLFQLVETGERSWKRFKPIITSSPIGALRETGVFGRRKLVCSYAEKKRFHLTGRPNLGPKMVGLNVKGHS
jgi:hypothetical protein